MLDRSRTLATLLLLSCLSIMLPTPVTDAATAVKTLALRQPELPAGFISAGSRYYSAAEIVNGTKVSASALRAHGWITTYEVRYTRATLRGITNVINDVIQYRTAAGAHWGATYATGGASGMKKVRVIGLGEESYGFTATQSGGGQSFQVDIIVFRRGSVAVTLTTAGFKGTYSLSAVIALARLVDRRIQRGH